MRLSAPRHPGDKKTLRIPMRGYELETVGTATSPGRVTNPHEGL